MSLPFCARRACGPFPRSAEREIPSPETAYRLRNSYAPDKACRKMGCCVSAIHASSKKKIPSTGCPSSRAVFIASSSVGSYLSFSIATMVCRDTPSSFAMSSCRRPRALRSSLMLFFMLSARTSTTDCRISPQERPRS